MQLGVKAKVTWGTHITEFHYTTTQYEQAISFPPSEGPRSVIQAASGEQKEKHISAYADTDAYISNLATTKYSADSKQRQLLHLTHVLTASRKESDRLLTDILNGRIPSKRRLEPADYSDDEDNEIKRQRRDDEQQIADEEEQIAIDADITKMESNGE